MPRRESPPSTAALDPWGPYPSYEDIARFEYGRMLWAVPRVRARLLRHWLDARHPHQARFAAQRAAVEALLGSTETPASLDSRLRAQGSSLRSAAREIPPVFGHFFAQSKVEKAT